MFDTLIGLLETQARERGEQTVFSFDDRTYTYAGLWQGLNRCAAALVEQGLGRGERVLIILPNGPEFFHAFYGVQRAGGIPVPLDPGSGPERIAAIGAHAQARILIALSGVAESGNGVLLQPKVWEGLRPGGAYPRLRPDDIAFIQYTSGSTGHPKGVLLTHRNLLANLQQLIAGMRIDGDDVFVSWLPLSHDMGLILMSMVPFFLGARLVLLPVSLTHARTWLNAIRHHRGTFTAAPDFAYRYCLRYLKDPHLYDLSSLRVALNAAEPVQGRTVSEFERVFGLDRVMVPGYGLAEASVGVSTGIPGEPVELDNDGCVCVGPPFPGMQVRIFDGDTQQPAGQVGEILLRGPSVTQGYFDNTRATQGLRGPDGYIRSGDLGYLDRQGRLFVTGRIKDIIIHAGRNIAPREVEEIMDNLDFVRRCAALGIDKGGTKGEQAYVFAELGRDRGTPAQRAAEMVRRFHAHFGFRPGRVYLLGPHSIPRTPNGKLMRGRLKQVYLQGVLRREGQILYPDY